MKSEKIDGSQGRLQGRVTNIEKTDEKMKDDQENIWQKCIITVELTGFSKRTSKKILPRKLKGKQIKLLRWCCFDWHYKIGARKTVEPNETEAILLDKPTYTAYW
jgi:lysozyme family protein